LRWGAALACVVVVGAVVTLHQRREQQIATMVAAERQADAQIDKKVASLQVPDSEVKPVFAAKQVIGAPKAIGASGADGNHPLMPPSPVEMADARAGSPLAEVVPGRAKDALAEPQNDSSENSMNAPSSRSRSMAGSVSDVAIPASLAPRWTLSSDGTLQRSLDSGATWQTVVVSSKTVFRALAANDLDIWVGGSAGALFHSSDAGEHWTRVQPVANGEALEDDIVGVEFTDTLHGKLTSSAEETWITADAGQTWQKE
jgi:photosynthesis system II assembly factor YCF48-like protein